MNLIAEYKTMFFKRHNILVTVIEILGKDANGKQCYVVESDVPNTDFEDGYFNKKWQLFDCTEDELEEIE